MHRNLPVLQELGTAPLRTPCPPRVGVSLDNSNAPSGYDGALPGCEASAPTSPCGPSISVACTYCIFARSPIKGSDATASSYSQHSSLSSLSSAVSSPLSQLPTPPPPPQPNRKTVCGSLRVPLTRMSTWAWEVSDSRRGLESGPGRLLPDFGSQSGGKTKMPTEGTYCGDVLMRKDVKFPAEGSIRQSRKKVEQTHRAWPQISISPSKYRPSDNPDKRISEKSQTGQRHVNGLKNTSISF